MYCAFYSYIIHGKYAIVVYPKIVAILACLLRYKRLRRRVKTNQATSGIVSFYVASFELLSVFCFWGFGGFGVLLSSFFRFVFSVIAPRCSLSLHGRMEVFCFTVDDKKQI